MLNRCILMAAIVALFFARSIAGAATNDMFTGMDGDLIARIHFAGTTRITSDPTAKKLNEFADMPETMVLRRRTLDKLSTAPFRLYPFNPAKGDTNEFSMLLRPLLDDLLQEESYVEVRGPGERIPEVMIAVHLNSSRAKAWRDNLSRSVSEWTGVQTKSINGDGYSGWELRKQEAPDVVRYLHAGDWVLFGWGHGDLRSQAGMLQRIKAQKRPVADFKDAWLEASVDWPALMQHHPFTLPEVFPATLPKMYLNVATRKDFIRPELVMEFPQPLNLKLDPWNIPTNVIRKPLVSFTAVRGIAPWLSQLEIVKKTQPPSVPNQMTFWSMGRVVYENNVMAPMPGASNYLEQIAPRLKPALESYFKERKMITTVEWTNHQMLVKGLAFIMPGLGSMHLPSGDYLAGGEFPVSRARTNSTPFPNELMRQIMSQPNLVCYSWEINAEHAPQWQALHIVDLMEQSKPLPPQSAPGMQWLRAAKTKLGNCATEINLTAPNELTLMRNAPIGLNGLEITALEYWLDAPNFPWDCTYPMMRPVPRNKQAK
jgi:hypothetical protein